MAGKTSGSYASITRGVSQQVPEQRLPGQHSEQVNMLSDPVTGVARRRGTRQFAEFLAADNSNPTATATDFRQFLERPFAINGTEYGLLTRKNAKTVGSSASAMYCLNKATKAQVPVSADAGATTLLNAGVSAMTKIGDLLIIAGRSHVAAGSEADVWDTAANLAQNALWIRGGAYSRTFKIVFTFDDATTYTVSYTTPASSYQNTLDTSSILATDPEYQKKVNDMVNAYNSAVTQWIGTASAAVQPAAIAASLNAAIIANAALYARLVTLELVNSHIGIKTATAGANTMKSIVVDDGGDGSLVRFVADVVTEAVKVTEYHQHGHVVKVQAKDGEEAYYLKAVSTNGDTSAGLKPVAWEESYGVAFTPGAWFVIATINAGTLYASTTPAGLRALVPSLTELPDLSARMTGDSESSPVPHFVGRTITHLTTFQDRLVVSSGGVTSMSEIASYFNFFRTTILTVPDSDPVEVFALGSEDDILRHSVIFDKSLLLFGDKQQYSINGRVPVTPATTAVIQSSAHEGATDAAPLASGDLVFYLKEREGVTQAYQINIGDVQDTSNSAELTQQLSDYMPGTPVEMTAMTSPNLLFVRTDSAPNTIFTFRYIDTEGGRKRVLDSWSKWTFAEQLGDIIGISVLEGTLLIYYARYGVDGGGTTKFTISVDRQSLLPKLDSLPYLDSMRPYTDVTSGASTRMLHSASTGIHTAYDNTTTAFLQGATSLAAVPGMITEFPAVPTSALWSGTPFDAYIEPTNPYTRDRNDTVIVTGRLTTTRFDVSYDNTAGLVATVTTANGTNIVLDFNGRVLGAANNLVGIQPVSKGSVPAFVGYEVREYMIRFAAKAWLPLTITGLEWTGQYFYHTRRQ